jgi:diamine N-acetyltransferase
MEEQTMPDAIPSPNPGPDADVSLREITETTLWPVLKLSETLVEPQKGMVASNAVSIAQAHFSKYAWFRAIYAAETPVGFLMLYVGPEDEDTGKDDTVFFLWRLMIGTPYQGQGFGRRAIELLIDHVRAQGATELLVSCGQGDGSPEGFYRKLGFERNGKMYGSEVGLVLRW